MRYWFDTEFIEDGKTIDLISIGIVAEDDRRFYALSTECDLTKANEWVCENVLVHLPEYGKYDIGTLWMPRAQMRANILHFVGNDSPEFWAYYADYDWVVLCQLFGRMMDLPEGWPMYCRDIKQWADELGCETLPLQEGAEHHALADALWCREAWEHLCTVSKAVTA
jgi:hypothetical protein